MSSRALIRGGLTPFLAATTALVALTAAASPGGATDNNARVAEYLLLQHPDAGDQNARVAEYLLQHEDSGH